VSAEGEEVMPRRHRVLLWSGIAFAALLVMLLAGLSWLLNTQSGAQWAANRAIGFMDGKLALREVSGTISGPLTVAGVRYRDPESGLDARVERVRVDVALRELLSRRVHVLQLAVNGVDVRLGESKKEEEPSKFSLTPPVDILLDRFTLQGARIERDGQELFVANTANAAGRWTAAGVAIEKFALVSPQGRVNITGEVAERGTGVLPTGGSARGPFVGKASGTFEWRAGETLYVGTLGAVSTERDVTLAVKLSAPMSAQVDAVLGQQSNFPWRFELRAPQFDPREGVLPGSSIQSLAAALTGKGDREIAEVKGEVAINGQPLRIEPLRVRLELPVIRLEALTLIDPQGRGRLDASGDVRLPSEEENQPLSANLQVGWKGVQLPKEWVGQPLATHGELKVAGSLATFEAGGQMALGPPGKLADITLAITGTPERIDVKRIAVVQKPGDLTASGHVLLKPQIAWQLSARATRFDPGAFVAGWNGRLGFDLATEGQLTEAGPAAKFDLKRLEGMLRGRPLAGNGALTLSADKVVAGSLRLRSGRSAVSVTGKGGKSLDLVADLEIASLADWLPDSGGSLNGNFHVTGNWPRIAVEGKAAGAKLEFLDYYVNGLDVTADVRNPQAPQGSVKLKATEVRAAGFQFSSVTLEAAGEEANHSAHLLVAGDPVSAELKVHGARKEMTWSGTIDQLSIAAAGIANLALRQPAQVSLAPKRFSISESCLADDRISACVAAEMQETGELQASYRLEHLPLGLIAALAMPDLPVDIEAVVQGNGKINRNADGALFGEAHVTSASGRVSEAGAQAEEDAADALLTYKDFKLDANLSGDTARGSAQASLGTADQEGNGSLNAQVALANLRSSAPSLDGKIELRIADLSPIGLFVPQVADVGGSASANVDLGGTIAAPRITGSGELRDLKAEVPQVGIQLREGALQASMTERNDITLDGRVKSGNGELTLKGSTGADRVLKVKVQGKDFEAANIPGAHVLITPDLDFTRSEKLMLLTGKVLVPQAAIDVQKLPKNKAAAASPDVVVIDDEEQMIREAQGVPLEANITIELGEKVTLVGFGLNATLKGQLRVHEKPGDPTLGSGQIEVAGIYKAYGQDLKIEQGRLLFAGTPLANPQLSITAVRDLPTVDARLNVTGTAERPILQVSSDPPLPQTQALSYLITGKPLNEVGQGEGDLVTSAARSLGGAAGNLLAKNLGKRLGIDEIGIEDSQEIGGSAFTVGQYLSPRLYLSYGVGLFEPGQVVTLRYRISDKWSLEGSQGPQNQRVGLDYRIEK
jgi:translocation and assembly module TamB